MLVLSRQKDECIRIGADIEVMVVDIRGDKVRLGINAPPTTTVHRAEVYDAVRLQRPHELPAFNERDPNRGRLRIAINKLIDDLKSQREHHKSECEKVHPHNLDNMRHAIRMNAIDELLAKLNDVASVK